MSQNFTGRTAPNVSQYLQGLNELPAPGHIQNDFTFDDAFDIANVDFLDLDAAGFGDPTSFEPDNTKDGQKYQFNDFQTFPANVTSPSSVMPSPSLVHGNFQAQPFAQSPMTGDKRKASVALASSSADLEEQSRMAAEEDKRRRNTAASARFRIKKKQREQALEKQTREMSDKLASYEAKVQQLEMENKWLKSLITEKTPTANLDFSAMKKEAEEQIAEKRVDGVGTKTADADGAAEA
ncbi:uncharacterized protein SEPMUDRAFT_152092 [Sphaerulina musiva SO2202]|uniref:BZIP domain-containing protein n=1 Tax=Sphaerulina musiva (strain SO2202) TaxID=692275 RepID=M3BQP7_SPHMS|nr:uncharacterized protein SEPMUDRAFT_152092 [Sphaerulina musiva SO2202]EMF08423.1 hypothetical protein SEPMUDRAFT_152092 [Sphaerulina musiva SO2202]